MVAGRHDHKVPKPHVSFRYSSRRAARPSSGVEHGGFDLLDDRQATRRRHIAARRDLAVSPAPTKCREDREPTLLRAQRQDPRPCGRSARSRTSVAGRWPAAERTRYRPEPARESAAVRGLHRHSADSAAAGASEAAVEVCGVNQMSPIKDPKRLLRKSGELMTK